MNGDSNALIWAVVLIFATGGLVTFVKMSLRQLKQDINGIGRKCSDEQKEAARLREIAMRDGARRYHNITMAMTLVAPPSKEHEVCELLKEG